VTRPVGGPTRARVARLGAGVLLLAVLAVVPAGPALADPARPTDFRSRVLTVEPPDAPVRARVLGGDAFVELRVEPGHEVVVLGYSDEPYLRFDRDGTVWANVHSPAHYLNDDRRGEVALPPEADHEADPEWERLTSDGTWAWHDHRVHWMGGPRTDREWRVDIVVDGEPAAIEGELLLQPSPSPLPPLAAATAAVALVVAAARRRSDLPVLAATGAAGAVALVLGWREAIQTPPGAGDLTTVLLVALPGLALAASATALLLRRRSAPVAQVAGLAAAAALVGWAVPRLSALWKAVLPTDLPFWLDRMGLAAVVVVAAGAALLLVLTPPASGSPSPRAAPRDSAP
jgi:hypothetical protein